MARDPRSRLGRDGTAGGGEEARGDEAGAPGPAVRGVTQLRGIRRPLIQAPCDPGAWGHDGAKVPGPPGPAGGGSR